MWKKIISTVIAVVLMITVCGSFTNSAKAAPEDGDICTNPWEELFTTEVTDPGDLEIPGKDNETTKNSTTDKETKKNKVTKPGRVKVIKASRKNKTAKITLKKVKTAKGYRVQISKTKKFKKILISKIVRKRKITITSNTLKNKKKLYVRAKAYKLNSKNKKIWGEWSKVKIIKKK